VFGTIKYKLRPTAIWRKSHDKLASVMRIAWKKGKSRWCG